MNNTQSMQIKISIFVGTQLDKEGNSLNPKIVSEVLLHFEKQLASLYGGFSCEEVTGGYVSSKGLLMKEKSVKYTLFLDNGTPLDKLLITSLRDNLKQECVLVSQEACAFNFV